jgi:putative ABC transport system substrate-binding protein
LLDRSQVCGYKDSPLSIRQTRRRCASPGYDLAEAFGKTAEYVDRILRGEKPGDLPVQQPIKFNLVFDLKTAKTIGLTIPSSMLSRADEVIE